MAVKASSVCAAIMFSWGIASTRKRQPAVLINGLACTRVIWATGMKRDFTTYAGRRTEVINCGGQKFVPRDVERCIEELPEVAEVAVAGVPYIAYWVKSPRHLWY